MSNASSKKKNIESRIENTEVIPNSSRKADLGGPVRIVLIAFLIFILSQFAALVLVEIFLRAFRPENQAGIDLSAGAQFAYILLAEVMVVGSVFWLLRRRKLGLGFIGFGRKIKWSDIGWAIAGFFSFYGLLLLATFILVLLIPSFDTDAPQDVGFNFLSTPLDQLIAFVALVILPPLGEETLMRGYLFSGLRAKFRFWPAAIVTSLLFGAAHLSSGVIGALWAAGVSTFILSMVLVALREKTAALYAPIMLHGLNNTVAFFAHFHS